jgi:DNA-binding transcriptional LysR family regulator
VGPDVRSGRLKPILCRFEPTPLNIYVVYPSRRHLSAKVRAFADFLVERFATERWDLPAVGPAARQRRKT